MTLAAVGEPPRAPDDQPPASEPLSVLDFVPRGLYSSPLLICASCTGLGSHAPTTRCRPVADFSKRPVSSSNTTIGYSVHSSPLASRWKAHSRSSQRICL